MCQGQKLLILASVPKGRGQSLGRFLGAAFLAFGLLLLLVGTQKGLAPALAGGGACIFSGLALLAGVRPGRASIFLLDAENGEAMLCRRRFGSRAFRRFSLSDLEILAAADNRHIHIRPVENSGTGREIPGLPSRIPDKEWRQGMTLPTPESATMEAVATLKHWQRPGHLGETPRVADACDAAEFAALLGKDLPATLLQSLFGDAGTNFQATAGGHGMKHTPEHFQHTPTSSRPEIRRAPDLRDAPGTRDKRQ